MPNSALIALANYYQFRSNDRLSFACIESRLFLFCESGKGVITVNKKAYAVMQGDFIIIPWGMSVSYFSDKSSPFLLGGIHVIPDAKENKDLHFCDVAHNRKSFLFGVPFRKDVFLPNLNDVFCGNFSNHPSLYHLATYIVQTFTRQEPEEKAMRVLAKLLMDEWLVVASTSVNENRHNCRELSKVILYIEKNSHRQIEIKELVEILGNSISTLTRLFKKNLSLSPIQYINQVKIKKAQNLLSQTNLSVLEVSRTVGIEDQFYFSKLFKSQGGLAPLAYRKKYSILSVSH